MSENLYLGFSGGVGVLCGGIHLAYYKKFGHFTIIKTVIDCGNIIILIKILNYMHLGDTNNSRNFFRKGMLMNDMMKIFIIGYLLIPIIYIYKKLDSGIKKNKRNCRKSKSKEFQIL